MQLSKIYIASDTEHELRCSSACFCYMFHLTEPCGILSTQKEICWCCVVVCTAHLPCLSLSEPRCWAGSGYVVHAKAGKGISLPLLPYCVNSTVENAEKVRGESKQRTLPPCQGILFNIFPELFSKKEDNVSVDAPRDGATCEPRNDKFEAREYSALTMDTFWTILTKVRLICTIVVLPLPFRSWICARPG